MEQHKVNLFEGGVTELSSMFGPYRCVPSSANFSSVGTGTTAAAVTATALIRNLEQVGVDQFRGHIL